jgi:catalase
MKANKYYCIISFLFLTSHALNGQIKIDGIFEKKANLLLNKETIDFSYIEVRDTQAFRQLTQRLNNPSNYPLSIVKKPVFDPLIQLVQEQDAQLDHYQQVERHYITLDSINQQKIMQLIKLDSIQNKRVENFRQLSEELQTTNSQLSKKINEAVDLTEKANQGRLRKQVWTGFLGGAVGFSVATLVALFAMR